jgi:hypothetical protein
VLRVLAFTALVAAVVVDAPGPTLDTSLPQALGAIPEAAPDAAASPTLSSAGPAAFRSKPSAFLDKPPLQSDPVALSDITVTSGLLSELPMPAQAAPVRLRLPDLGIDAPVAPAGYDRGEMEIPARADTVGWYRFGPAPGGPGSAVLAAHVAWGGRAGVFADLRLVRVGAIVEVDFSDGATRRFRVEALASYDKEGLPVQEIFRRGGDPVLTLITCGGAFNPSLRSFEDNVVAYAVPVPEALDR